MTLLAGQTPCGATGPERQSQGGNDTIRPPSKTVVHCVTYFKSFKQITTDNGWCEMHQPLSAVQFQFRKAVAIFNFSVSHCLTEPLRCRTPVSSKFFRRKPPLSKGGARPLGSPKGKPAFWGEEESLAIRDLPLATNHGLAMRAPTTGGGIAVNNVRLRPIPLAQGSFHMGSHATP